MLTRCFISATFNPVLSSANKVLIWFDVLQDAGLFQNCLEGGFPYSTGVFFIDLSYFLLIIASGWWIGAVLPSDFSVNFYDGITSPGTLLEYTIPTIGRRFAGSVPPIPPGGGTSPCRAAFDLAVARSKGLRTITSITFSTPLGTGPKLPVATGTVFGVFYPNGVE
jgi:hypothetical protein